MSWTIERCAKETDHRQKKNSHFCHCTHVMYDSDKPEAEAMPEIKPEDRTGQLESELTTLRASLEQAQKERDELDRCRVSAEFEVTMLRNTNHELLSHASRTIEGLDKDVAALRAELEQVRGAWVSVEERLPNEDELVLVAVACETDDHDGVTQAWNEVHEATLYRAGGQLIAVGASDCEYEGEEILGWQPLPAPPSPSKEGR